MTESQIQTAIFKSAYGNMHINFLRRNNVGAIKKGARFISYGLGKGSSDLIGMMRDGRFLAVEVKTPCGIASPEQIEFVNTVNRCGGVAFFATSVDDFNSKIISAVNYQAMKNVTKTADPF